jgi:hypothetical protein
MGIKLFIVCRDFLLRGVCLVIGTLLFTFSEILDTIIKGSYFACVFLSRASVAMYRVSLLLGLIRTIGLDNAIKAFPWRRTK